MTEECDHPIIMLGSHPDFKKTGWICASCGKALGDLGGDFRDEYPCVVFAALKIRPREQEKGS